MPAHTQYAIKQLGIENTNRLMPQLSFPGGGYLSAKGMMHITSARGGELDFDATGVPNSADARMEVTPRSCFFADKNMQQVGAPLLFTRNLGQSRGTIKLQAAYFPAPGLYALRIRALDRSGKPTGVAGDHIFVSVE